MRIYSSDVLKQKIARQKKVKNALSVVWWAIVIFAVVLSVIVLFQKFVLKSNGVNIFGYSSFIVLSGSMQPEINVGDIVITNEADKANIAENDIITFFDENGNTITHRVKTIFVSNGVKKYETKGDNNNTCDVGLISDENIIGKYCFKIPHLGRIIYAAFTPLGVLLIVLVFVLIYFNSSRLSDRKIARHAIRERYKKQNATEE